MTDGKWTMTNDDARRVDLSFSGSAELETGFGGYGEGFGYKSYRCSKCGGTTDAVYKDEKGCLL